MKLHFCHLAAVMLAVSSVALVIVASRAEQNERASARAIAAMGAFCQRQEDSLDIRVHDKTHRDLRQLMVSHFLDESVSTLCLGKEVPVDESAASMCWLERGEDACYAPLAMELLSLYRKREH